MGEHKLTPPQAELLRDINRRSERVVSSYKPALKLAALGLAVLTDEGPPFSFRVTITPAGRAALEEGGGADG